jgi:hypothetical protein
MVGLWNFVGEAGTETQLLMAGACYHLDPYPHFVSVSHRSNLHRELQPLG